MLANYHGTSASNSLVQNKKALVSICRNKVNQGLGIRRNGLEIVYWG
jgi:hypothetical protein